MEEYGSPRKYVFTCLNEQEGECNGFTNGEGYYAVALGEQIRKNLDERLRTLPLTFRAIAIRAWATKPFRVVVQKTPFERGPLLSEPLWAGSFASHDIPPSTEFLFDGESSTAPGHNSLSFLLNKNPIVVVGENLKLFILFYTPKEGGQKVSLSGEVDFFVGHPEGTIAKGKKYPIVSSIALTNLSNNKSNLCTRKQASVLPREKKTKKKGLKNKKKKVTKKKKNTVRSRQVKNMLSAKDIANRFAELQAQVSKQ